MRSTITFWSMVMLLTNVRPCSGQNLPRITSSHVSAGALHLAWTGNSSSFEVQASSSLSDPRWRPAVITTHSNAVLAVDGTTRFYRVVTSPTLAPDKPVDDTTRMRVMEAVNQRIADLPGDDAHADGRDLLSFLSGLGEFNDSGISSDSSVWARFTDGRLLLIINNRQPADSNPIVRKPQAVQGLESLPPIPSRPLLRTGVSTGSLTVPPPPQLMDVQPVRPTALPFSSRAVLFKATLPSIEAPVLNSLVPAFRNRQYEVMGGEATLPQLKNVANLGGDIGILYIDSHGGLAMLRSITTNGTTGDRIIMDQSIFAVATSTLVTPANESLFKADFDKGEVCYAALGPAALKGLRRESGEPTTFPLFYCILPRFVSQHWSFGRNSLVYIDTCHGGSAGASSFVEACIAKGTDMYAGWSKEVDDGGALQTTQVVFDTLLGGSQILDVSPPQRAFDRLAAVDYLQRSGFDTDPKDGAKLSWYESADRGSNFGLLAPSIFSMHVDESKEELRIVGLFDPDAPTTVRLGNGTASVEIPATARRIENSGMALNPTEVVCPLPARRQPSAGDVTVVQRGHDSNTVPLTEWWLEATGEKYFSIGRPQPSATTEFRLHFRADVHSSRLRPYEEPTFRGSGATAASDSTCRVSHASGVYPYPDGNGTVTWSLPRPVDLTITYVGFNQVDSAFYGSLSFFSDGTGGVSMIAKAKNAMTVTTTFDNVQTSYQTDPGTRTFPAGQTRFDLTSFTIQSGSGTAASDAGIFRWNTSTATHAPDRNALGYAE
ncbi:MAG: hypothetical protein JNN07_02700 [Verrucomicrobiales bacterium]|nr:hypothetical protein [Verrucomicrobiales bacterium]